MVYQRYGLIALLACLLVVVSACGGGPPPKLYLLELPATDISESPSSIDALGIAQITLPGYATDERIASLSSAGVVSQFNDHRWAEEPEVAITRLLAEQLEQHGAKTVLQEPLPRDYKPDARVEVNFSRLLREKHGGASLSGQIQLLSGDGRSLLQLIAFDFAVLGESTGSREYFRAVATGVDEIAQMAIEALTTPDVNS